MVVLTISNFSNGATVYFDYPIPEPRFVRIVSFSMYNSWNNFEGGTFTSTKNAASGDVKTVFTFPAGFYNIDLFVEILKNILVNTSDLVVEKNRVNPNAAFSLKNSSDVSVSFSEAFGKVFDIKKTSDRYVSKRNLK